MASTIILSDNGASSGSAGLKSTAGNDGVLILQSTTSGGTATNALYIDNSQNVGLGVVPSAWATDWKAVQVGARSFYGQNGGTSTRMGYNWYQNSGGTNTYIGTDYASGYLMDSAHKWLVAASGTAGNAISFTQAMTLDASGNLMVGRTSTTYKLDVKGNAGIRAIDTDDLRSLILTPPNSGGDAAFVESSSANGLVLRANNASGFIGFTTGGTTERARIDSSGRLLVGTTSTVDSATISVLAVGGTVIGSRVAVNGNYVLAAANSSGTVVGGVIANASTTSFPTSSDYRLKENVAPMTGALATVAALKPCTYTWKATGEDGQGFIAHELQAVVPDAVVGEKDAVDEDGNPKYQGIDTSFLVATLTAAIQEQQAIIEALTNRITALENK